ncbi:CPBP family intramembrane glutamic endopeptidase [Thermodesulfobium sp. 4217-1]|uniref:CPBP family intramembrane glutamic endopeptidase n=1 Tax=Thermodesulfobium sp. 4217-1 TaxID=3120013 RepID=UPI00322194D3
MEHNNIEKSEDLKILLLTVSELMFAIVAILALRFLDHPIYFSTTKTVIFISTTIGGGLFIFTYFLSRKFDFIKDMGNQIQSFIFKDIGALEIFYLALLSSFCEEIFFRGLLQRLFDVPFAALVFGLFHMSEWTNKGMANAMYLAFLGLCFGLLYNYTHTITAPIIAHFSVKFCVGIANYWLDPDRL